MKFFKWTYIFQSFIALLITFLCSCGIKPPLEPAGPLVVCNQNESYSIQTNAERFGFFSEEIYKDYEACFLTFTKEYGVKPGYIIRFQQIDDAFPTGFVNYYLAHSIHTVISLNLMTKNADSNRNDTLLREITLGSWDSTLKSFAIQAKQINAEIYLRFGYEMNGDWFAWGGKPKDFIAAWKHAYKIFKDEQANNVLWVFSPGVLWDGATINNDLLNYYPGDSFVDIIGLDGYNYGDIVKDGYQLHWKSFHDVFGTSLMAMDKINKPIWITEIGCATDKRRPDWLKEVFNFMDNNPCINAMLWFNAYKNNESDFQLNSDSLTINLVRKWLTK